MLTTSQPAAPGVPEKHHYCDLISLFEQCFFEQYNTRLVKGDDEPIYLPAGQGACYNQIVFAHGYYASALHEIAHWCVAGEQRRTQTDYGYWYCPDGRDAQQQAEFERVEVTPQAIEWGFSAAAGKAFRVSTDNLNGVTPDTAGFTQKVRQQAITYLHKGFPPRAQAFIRALQQHYQTPALTKQSFKGQ